MPPERSPNEQGPCQFVRGKIGLTWAGVALYRYCFRGVQVRRSCLLNHGRWIQLPYTPPFLIHYKG